MKEHVIRDDRVAILADSLSIVSGLEKNMMLSTWWDSIKDVKAHIIFVYVPGHHAHEPDNVIESRRLGQGSTSRRAPDIRSRSQCNDW
jgi:hypothetical protein